MPAYTQRTNPASSNSWIIKRHRYFVWVIALILSVTSSNSYCVTIEEEELVERDFLFSVPTELAEKHRRDAAESGFSLLGGFSFFGGSDDNIHRGPEELELSGSTWGDWLYLRGDKRFTGGSRLLTTFTWKQVIYPDQPTASFRRGHLSTWYTRHLARHLRIELDLDVSAENDDATKITGKSWLRDYSYWRYAGETVLVWLPDGGNRLKIGGEFVRKDYGEQPNLNSLDWNNWKLKFRYRRRFGPYHYLRLRYSLSNRQYDVEPAGTKDGSELVTNPAEKHRYQEAIAWYSLPVARHTHWNLRYEYTTKHDLFEDYESWQAQSIEIWFHITVSARLKFRGLYEFEDRRFDHLLGDDGKTLEYTKWTAGVGAQFQATSFLFLQAEGRMYKRDSNRSTGSSYRDYKGAITSIGASIFL